MNNITNIKNCKIQTYSPLLESQIKELKNINKGKDLIKYKEIYLYLQKRFKGIRYTEAYYMITHNMLHRPICPVCNKKEISFISLSQGYKQYCSSYCSHYSKNTIEKFKKTCVEKYGLTSPLKSKEIKEKIKKTCLEKYGVDNVLKSNLIKEKYKKTCLEKYGVDNAAKSNIIKEKQKQTCLKKYGKTTPLLDESIKEKTKTTINRLYNVDYYVQSNDFKEKSAITKFIKYQNPNYNNRYKYCQTCLDLYGYASPIQNPEIKQKIENTNMHNLGVRMPLLSEEIRAKIKESQLEKYGCIYQSSKESKQYMSYKISTDVVQDKINNTKRKNHTFNTSKSEEELFLYIKERFPSVKRQYKEKERYPYNCDYYIPEIDYFIELQGSWTHGGHAYDIDSGEDQLVLKQWKEKSKEHLYYANAIKTWTIYDINKRETARKNNLNFKEVWSLNEGKVFIDNLYRGIQGETI